MKTPEITVIIANYKGGKFIVNCVNSLLKEVSENYEIVIVDDCSPDNSLELIRGAFHNNPKVKLIVLPKNSGGPSVPINTAVKNSKGDFIFYLNNDTVVEKGWSKAIPNIFKEYPKAGIVQTKILRMGTNLHDYAGDYLNNLGFLSERARNAEDTGQFDKVTEVFSIKGTTMIMRRDVLEKLNGFDEEFIYAIEETDLCWRAWLIGYQVLYYPFLKVHHAYGTTDKPKAYYVASRIIFYGARNIIHMHIKNLGMLRFFTMLPLHIACWLIIAFSWMIKGNTLNAFDIIKGVLWNVMNLPSILKKRNYIQRTRIITDTKLFEKLGTSQPLSYYFGKARAYINQQPF